MFMLLLAGFKTLLHRYAGQDDVVIGSPIAGRNTTEIENLIGFFVNTLVFRTDFSGAPSFKGLLSRVRKVALEAYTHQDLPFEKLVEELQPERSLDRTPLFQSMFVFQNVPMPALAFDGLEIAPFEVDYGTAKFDLLLNLWEWPDSIGGLFQYDTDLFDATTIARMAGHLNALLENAAAYPERPVWALDLLSRSERQQLLVDWNDT